MIQCYQIESKIYIIFAKYSRPVGMPFANSPKKFALSSDKKILFVAGNWDNSEQLYIHFIYEKKVSRLY